MADRERISAAMVMCLRPACDSPARPTRSCTHVRTRKFLHALEEHPMARHPSFVPAGVIPAVLLPFEDDLAIDEKSFRSHLRHVAAAEGLSAITLNAHSTEVASCTFEEQRRVMA